MRPTNAARNVISRQAKGFAPWNIFSSLVLSPESQPFSMVARVLEDYGIAVHLASTVPEADQFMRSTRLDLAICDFDVPQADQLGCLQLSSRWRGVTIGLMPRARLHHSHKRLQLRMLKPVSVDMLARCLKASYTNMLQQRVAAYRHTVPTKLVAATLNHRGWQRTLHHVSVLNLSQTGLCLSAPEPLPHGASLTMNLVLPECSYSLHASGSVVWSHTNGRAGVAFERAACREMKKLQERFNAWLPRELGAAAQVN